MKYLLTTSGIIFALFTIVACNPDPSATSTESGQVQSTTDGGEVEPATETATETPEPNESEKSEAGGEKENPENAISAN